MQTSTTDTPTTPMGVVINGAINTGHPQAYKALQAIKEGQTVKTCWQNKKGRWMQGTYTRQVFRPNRSRKWDKQGILQAVRNMVGIS